MLVFALSLFFYLPLLLFEIQLMNGLIEKKMDIFYLTYMNKIFVLFFLVLMIFFSNASFCPLSVLLSPSSIIRNSIDERTHRKKNGYILFNLHEQNICVVFLSVNDIF